MAAFASLRMVTYRRNRMIDVARASPGIVAVWIRAVRIQVTSAAIGRGRDMLRILAQYLTVLRVITVMAAFAVIHDANVIEHSARPTATWIPMA